MSLALAGGFFTTDLPGKQSNHRSPLKARIFPGVKEAKVRKMQAREDLKTPLLPCKMGGSWRRNVYDL